MRKWQKIVGGLLILAGIVGATAYTFRTDLILWGVKNRDLPVIAAETPEIDWEQGPAEPAQPIGERSRLSVAALPEGWCPRQTSIASPLKV